MLDTPPEQALDDLASLAAQLCGAPIALISLIDEHRQWFKSHVGTEIVETPLDVSFCVYALGQPGLLIVPDATVDERFAHNPLVVGEPRIRFYAGAPLLTPEGLALGTLCVVDVAPRTLSPQQEQALRVLSQQVMTHLELRRQWRELRASEGKLRAIFEAEPECVKLLATDGTLHEINETGLQMLQAERLEALPGRNLFSLIVPEDRQAVRAMLATVAAGEKRRVEYQLIGLQGTLRRIEMSGAPFHDEATDEHLVLGISLDITARRLAEFRLNRVNRLHTVLSKIGEAIVRQGEAEELYKSVCRIVVEDGRLRMVFIAEVDAATGLVRRAASYGDGDEHLRNLTVRMDGGPQSLGTVGTALRTGLPDFCNSFATDPRMAPWRESALRHGFGATASFPLNVEGATVGALVLFASEPGYFQDDEIRLMSAVAESLAFALGRKHAEAKIAEQAALIDHAPDAIMVRDIEHRITFWSKGAVSLFGWSVEEAVGRKVTDLLQPDPETFRKALETLLREGAWRGQIEKVTKTGDRLTLESSWTLLRDAHGQFRSVLAICSDITERKKLEHQLLRAQRMDSIGTLAGGIAHDLNNCLAPIMMSISLLQMRFPDAASAELFSLIEASAQRGADMVRQVLTFARGVEGRRTITTIAPLMREIEKIANDTFLKKIEVEITLADDLWPVLGDPTQLHQVLLNLCVNAYDAMPKGGTLTLSARNMNIDEHYSGLSWSSQVKPGHYVSIQVADTGTGIRPEILEKIFDPFFTTKEIGKGTGLGLSTTLAIVKSHDGFVRVYSELGKGTKFEIYLPAHADGAQALAPEPPSKPPHGRGELILVVDDELAVRLITQRTLESFGYRVVLASDGAEAVMVFASRRDEIAAVITDMMMPIMDGPATINILRRMSPDLPIIAASGLATDARSANIGSLGVKHFLPKPYAATALLTALRQELSPEEAS